MRRREVLGGAFVLAVGARCPVAIAQTAAPKRLGLLFLGSAEWSPGARSFQEGMLALGHVDHVTIVSEHHFAEGDVRRLTASAEALAAARVDVIVAFGSQ